MKNNDIEKINKMLVPKEEEPYKIPNNWVWTRLGDITESFDKKRKPVSLAERSKIENPKIYPYYGATGIIDYIDEYIFNGRYILLGEDGANLLSRSKENAFIAEGKFWVNNHAHILKNRDIILDRFFVYFYNNLDLSEYVTGSAQPKLNAVNLAKIKFILPPLEEQKRIVDKLDSFFDKIQKVKDIIQDVKEKNALRKESILSKAFSGELTAKWRVDNFYDAKELLDKINEEKISNWELECKKAEEEGRKKPSKPKLKSIEEMQIPNDEIPYQIPKNWVWTRLGDIVEINPKKLTLSYNDEEQVSFVPMKAVSEITGQIENLEFEKYGKLKKGYTQFIEEDILFAKITPCMENGKCAIAKNLKDRVGYGTTEFHVLRVNKYLDNRFLFNFLRQESFRKDAQYHMTGSVGFRRVPTEYMKNLVFPLPPLEEQKEIVKILDNIFSKENTISELISLEDKIQVLEKSILDKAFRGELGTHSPNDIDAHEILKNL